MACSRITRAIPATSSTVSPLMRSAVRNEPICAGVAAPVMISSIAPVASSSLSESPATSCAIASRIIGLRSSMHRLRWLHGFYGLHRMHGFREEVAQQVFANRGQDGFRVKLHATDGKEAMPQTHNQPAVAFSDDFQRNGQRRAFNDEAVIARRCEVLRQPAKDAALRMVNLRRFAMHRRRRTHHPPAEHFTDALMPQANAKRGDARPQAFDDGVRDACLTRRAGSRRNDDLIGSQRFSLLQRDLIVAIDLHLCAQFSEILVEVVGEAVVVVYQQEHRASASSSARSTAPSLFSVSMNSASGVESATMPPPAWA